MRFFLTIITLALAVSAFGQTPNSVEWYDANWNSCQKADAAFYSEVYYNKDGTTTVKDHYKSGQVQMVGHFQTRARKVKQGAFTYYFDNGQKSSAGEFKGGNRVGEWLWYHRDGSIKEKGTYNRQGQKTGLWRSWYADGKTDFEGEFKKDQRVGTWRWYHPNGQKSSEEIYSSGRAVSQSWYSLLGGPCVGDRCGEVQPSYPGGEDRLFSYIKKNLIYPSAAKPDNATGTVWIRFLVGADGKISDCSISKSVHKALDAEALRVVQEMPDWKPGLKHNRPTDFYLELPFHFKP